MGRRSGRACNSVEEVLALLRQDHPEAFPRRGVRPPLHAAIVEDIREAYPGVDVALVRRSMFAWMRSAPYAAGLAAGGARVDLSGAPRGWVDLRTSRKAAAKLARSAPGALGGPTSGREVVIGPYRARLRAS